MAADPLPPGMRVLLLAPTARDGQASRALLGSAGIECVLCRDLDDVCAGAVAGADAVIIPEEAVLADTGQQLAAVLRRQPVWSDLPVVVLARGGAESPAVATALSTLGNVSVVERPVRVTSLLSVVRTALRARARQYQVRDQVAALAASEARYRTLFESIDEGFCVLEVLFDAAGEPVDYVFHETNPAFARQSGMGDVTGRRMREIAPGHEDHWFRTYGAVARTGEPVRFVNHAQALGRWFDVYAFRLGGPGSARVGVVFSDVTERRRAEEQREALLASERAARAEAERAGRMKDEFLATLSHELRTPLNAILGWATILRDGPRDETDLQDGLATIERNARAQTQIISDLLDMSRIVSGKIRLEVRPADLAAVVREAVETVRPGAEAKGVGLHVHLDPRAGPITADPGRLQQVLWNLLSNAIKFTPAGGQVRVNLRHAGAHLELRVTDSGEGIDPAFVPHVFDRFRQADASTTRRHGGLGLGLAITKQLVELHGGTIEVSSPGKGRGSTFAVTLPLTEARREPAAAPRSAGDLAPATDGAPAAAAENDWPDLKGVRALVVDDEDDARALVRRLLEDCGATVETAASVEEAFRLVPRQRFDVLISDIGMPGEDGYSLINRVRALGAGRGGDVPAVALTAYARTEDRVRAMRAGYQTHVVKPVEPAELMTVVASLAGRTPQYPPAVATSDKAGPA